MFCDILIQILVYINGNVNCFHESDKKRKTRKFLEKQCYINTHVNDVIMKANVANAVKFCIKF